MRKLIVLLLVLVMVMPAANAVAQDEMAFDCLTDDTVTITYYGDPAGGHPAAEAEIISRFSEVCPNITVARINGSPDTTEVLGLFLQMFEAESGDIDVIRVDVVYPGQLAEHLLDLSPYYSEEELAMYLPALIDNDTVDGRLVAMPLRLGFGMLYYRTDLLEKYGYDGPPATWDELEEMAQTIQDGERAEGNEDFWGYVWQGNSYEGLTCDALEWQISASGKNFVSPEGQVQVTDEATIAMFERAAGWVGTISPPGVTGYGEEDARGIWHAGNAAFMRNWPYAYSTSLEDDSAVADVFDVAPLPMGAAGRSGATLGGWHMGVSAYSEHPEAAAAFAKFFISYDQQKFYAIATSSPPGIADLYADPDVQAAMPFLSPEVVEGTVARPSNGAGAKYNEASTLYFTAVHSILTGEEDAATAMELLDLDLTELLEE
jgi:trehalose/maltose transport system substrate-binding protein